MNVLAVDIGGTKIACGVVDTETGGVVRSERTPTNASEGGAAILARAIALARQICADTEIGAVGIGAGGQINYRTGIVLSATDILPGWAGTRLAESFAEAFNVPAFADNDVNAFAQGEHRFGAGRGASDVVYVAVGTGVGGAIFIGGKLHRGARGSGGELGHMILSGDPEYPVTLEQRTAGGTLPGYYKSRGGKLELDSYAVGQAAQSGDNAAIRAIAWNGCQLGLGLASLANILDTERIVIGGGLADLGDLLLEPARQNFARLALPIYRDTPILPAALGSNASIVGAACVALNALETETRHA